MGLAEWSEDNDEATQTVAEVGTLLGVSCATQFGFNLLAAFNHAKDPKKGMPGAGPVGVDAIAGGVGLLAAVFGGEALGSMGQTIALGVAVGGLGNASGTVGAKVGTWLATPATKKVEGHEVGTMGAGSPPLDAEAAAAYEKYMGR